MLKNYEELKVWQKSYNLCLELRNRKNVEGADKVVRKQTLESLNPGILGPSSPTKLEKNLNYYLCHRAGVALVDAVRFKGTAGFSLKRSVPPASVGPAVQS